MTSRISIQLTVPKYLLSTRISRILYWVCERVFSQRLKGSPVKIYVAHFLCRTLLSLSHSYKLHQLQLPWTPVCFLHQQEHCSLSFTMPYCVFKCDPMQKAWINVEVTSSVSLLPGTTVLCCPVLPNAKKKNRFCPVL